MSTGQQFLRTSIATFGVVAALLGLRFLVNVVDSGQPSTTSEHYSMAEYATVAELTRGSDRVVVATVLDSGSASVDYGLERTESGQPVNPGLPVTIYQVLVESDLKSSKSTTERILSIVYPSQDDQKEGFTPLNQGDRVVLYLAHFATTGVKGLSSAYVSLSYDNGVFDLVGSSAVPRSPLVTGVLSPSASSVQAQGGVGLRELEELAQSAASSTS